MVEESKIEDTVIKVYMEMYLTGITDERSDRYLNNIMNRMQTLIERKKLRKQIK
tara:strand:+ start:3923 stop:4084 length:162 start_codon:yes stop_codon:yes gene_type:complete